jgi:RNA polymerase sigma factor (sigma-70 family)
VSDDPRELAEQHRHLVPYTVGRLPYATRKQHGPQDLTGIGYVGLMKAAATFDPARGKFSTHAVVRIRGAILDSIRASHGREGSARRNARFVSDRALTTHAAPETEPEPERWPEETRLRLRDGLAKLAPRDREVLELAYGLDSDPLSAKQIAQRYGVTTTYIHQIRADALKKLREHLDPTAAGGHA